jgi:carboxymethylenebutenolidase
MKPADLGNCDDPPRRNRLYLTPAWAVVTETLVRPRDVVVHEVGAKQATQVAFVEHEDEIEAVAANRADDALGEGILPWRARGDDDLKNAHALDPALEVSAEDGIAIAEQVSGAGLVRESVGDLLSRPRGSGLVGDADVEEFSAVVVEDHEAEEQAKRQGRYDEEVDGRDVVTVSSQKGSPRRRWGHHADGGSVMTVGLESVTFMSGDEETSVPSYLATPDHSGPHPVVLILRGVAGPDDGYTEIACRLAEWGYVALVHGWKVRGADPTDGPVYSDLQGAMTFLRSVGQADLARLAVFGFCRGGVHALMAARAHAEIRVIVVFHGFAFRPAGAQPGAEPYDLAEGVNVPMLVLHGTEDERAPIGDMRRMEARMRALGKDCTFTFYEDARHGFAVRTHPGYAEDAARQSFDEARRFLATHLRT